MRKFECAMLCKGVRVKIRSMMGPLSVVVGGGIRRQSGLRSRAVEGGLLS
jgi:hypothetical protein